MSDDAFPLPGVTAIQTITEWENYFSPSVVSGVLSEVSGLLAPSLDTTGRNAVIQPGAAMIQGFYKPVSAATSTAIPGASSQDRIDRLVLRLNRAATSGSQLVVPTVLTGTPGSGQPPALTRTATGLWDLPLSHWTTYANGGLGALVDERCFTGNALFKVPSAAALPQPGVPAIAIEQDNSNVWISKDGFNWQLIWAPQDPWHSLSIVNGWHGTARYRKLPDGDVEIDVFITSEDATSFQFGTMPAGYRPAATKYVAMANDAGNLAGTATPYVQVLTTGVINMGGLHAFSTPGNWFGCGSYPTN